MLDAVRATILESETRFSVAVVVATVYIGRPLGDSSERKARAKMVKSSYCACRIDDGRSAVWHIDVHSRWRFMCRA